MDTKSKSIKYSKGTKITAAIVVWLCIMCALGSGIFLLYNENIITTQSYFETIDFKVDFARLVHNAVEYNVKLKSVENITASGEGENKVSYNLARFNAIKTRFSNTVNFAYYIKNTQTNKIITNVKSREAIDLIKKQSNAVYFNQWEYDVNLPMNEDIKQMLTDTPYEVYAAVVEPLKQGDAFYDDYMDYNKIKPIIKYGIILLIASLIMLCIVFIYLICVTGRQEKGGDIVLLFIDRLYTDVHTLLVLIAAIISIVIVGELNRYDNREFLIFGSIVFGIDMCIGLSYVLSMVRQIKNKQIFKNTLTFKVLKLLKAFIKLGFNGKIFKVWTLLLLLAYGVMNGILFAFLVSATEYFLISAFLIIAFNFAAIYFAAKSLLSLTQIMEGVKEISAGNLDYELDNSKISVAFSNFAEDIQSVQGGIKKAVVEAVKGEHMKTELITNVSHDLKTPLTSIINYVDLLKNEDLNNKKADEYVGILEEKSARLKQLVEDLIEASKASSGNLTVTLEKVDLHELIMQACGEYEEKIKKAELDIRINTGEKKTQIYADGKYMWRIVENLLSNVIKYSMHHSRVYINIDKVEQYGVLTIKNISAFPLNISPEQITERFVRGDESRTTEGSGLGLSIAQSLTNIQGGMFKIEIDGDLFKTTVEMPLCMEM